MRFEEIRDVVLADLQSLDGRFTTAYQICIRIRMNNLQLWQTLVESYPTGDGNPEMGHDAGSQYTPATFVAKSLEHFQREHAQIRREFFDSTNVVFAEVEPGFRGGYVTIWAWLS